MRESTSPIFEGYAYSLLARGKTLGAAIDPDMLFGSRDMQGPFFAMLAPAGLSLLPTTFTRADYPGRRKPRGPISFEASCAATRGRAEAEAG